MKTFGKWVCKIEKGIGGALLLLMMGLVFFATFGRYTGLYNMAWSDEASRYCMIHIGIFREGLVWPILI